MNSLNSKQSEAVLKTEGPLLILAGAGAGKTKTLTERILHIISKKTEGVTGNNILAITFTNKAAKEMRERVFKNMYERNIDGAVPFISTFHALGVHILRQHSQIFGLPRHFSIFDSSDSKRAIKNAMEKVGLNPKEYDPGNIMYRISKEKGEGRNLLFFKQHAKTNDFTESITVQVWEKYEEILNKEKSLDFDDLLLKTAELLEHHPKILESYQEMWRYIHIDEYQDTNKVQYLIAKKLGSKYRNICVVGDIDQNIYSWRGADIRNILNFEKDYPNAEIVLLEENYRSTEIILGAANDIIKKNVHRREKNLFTSKKGGDKIKIFGAADENDEAEFIASTCFDLIRQGIDPQEIAVLYRANYQSRVLEDACIRHGLPYDMLGVRYFERKEIKDALSYIRASLNEDGESDVKRIINVPGRGIGKQGEEKIIMSEYLTQNGTETNLSTLPKPLQEKARVFKKLLKTIREILMAEKPSAAIKKIIDITGLEAMYESGKNEDEDKLENLRELVTVATKYDELPQEEAILKMLEEAALASDQDNIDRKKGIKLMTVHASKGLEFECVFVTGLESDLFPHKRSFEDSLTAEQAEEERRLFYVAITRAKQKLWFTHCSFRTIFGQQRINTPSEFIFDIEEDRIEHLRNNVGIKSIFIDF